MCNHHELDVFILYCLKYFFSAMYIPDIISFTYLFIYLFIFLPLEKILFGFLCPFQDVKDDYVFECEGGTQYQKTKLTILQSLGDPLYYGKIQPWKADEENDSQMSPSQ